jgi:hypothetical protein
MPAAHDNPLLAPSAAEKGIQCVDDADIFAGERRDGCSKTVTRNMSDLEWIENDLSAFDNEMGPYIAVGLTECLRRQERNDDSPCGLPESVGLDDHDKRNNFPVPAGVPVNTELIRHLKGAELVRQRTILFDKCIARGDMGSDFPLTLRGFRFGAIDKRRQQALNRLR